MKILITGIEGFVGRHLANELLSHGAELHGIYYPKASVEHLQATPVALYPADVTDRARVEEVLRVAKPEAVVHLAAVAFVPAAMSDPLGTWRVNLFGGLNILEWVRHESPDTRVLVVSSGEVYGAPVSIDSLPFVEASPFRPANVYAATKAALDIATQQYRRSWGLNVVVARPFNHIGPGQSSDFVVSAFARQVAEIARGKREPVIRVGNLEAARDFTDVRDVVRAYRLLLDGAEPDVYNICSGRAEKISVLLAKLIELAGIDARVEFDPSRLRPVDVPELRGDYSRIESAVGWSPNIPLHTSLKDTLDWWLDKL